MPGSHKFQPFHEVDICAQTTISAERNQNVIDSSGGQDAPANQMRVLQEALYQWYKHISVMHWLAYT